MHKRRVHHDGEIRREWGFHVLSESHDYVDRLGVSIRVLDSSVVKSGESNSTKVGSMQSFLGQGDSSLQPLLVNSERESTPPKVRRVAVMRSYRILGFHSISQAADTLLDLLVLTLDCAAPRKPKGKHSFQDDMHTDRLGKNTVNASGDDQRELARRERPTSIMAGCKMLLPQGCRQ